MKRRILAAALLLGLGASVGVAGAAEVAAPDTGHVQNPVWAPDGSWLAFEVNNMSNSVELFLAEVNGTAAGSPQALRIPGSSSSFGTGGYLAASPTWASKPNLMVIFEGSSPGGTMRLYYATPGAGAPNELINSTQIAGNLAAPSMSDNGERFAFVTDATGAGDVYVWELASSDMHNTFASDFSEHNPRWNADASKLVFSRKNNGTEDLFTWEGGAKLKPLVGGNGDQTRPIWTGDQVVYFSSERGDGHWDIAVADGSGRKVVARDVRLPARSAPALSPDGQWVAYGSSEPDKSGQIYLSRVDGSKTVSIDTPHVAVGEPNLVKNAAGRTMLAYTGLPSKGSDWRQLHIEDVTGKF